MRIPVRRPSPPALVVGVVVLALLTGSTAWAGASPNKLRVGMLLTLEGVDAAGATYEQNVWVAGRAFLPFTEGNRFNVVEALQGDELRMVLARWDRQGDLYLYEGASEVAHFVNGPVGTTFQYGDTEATIVSVGETVVVPAGTFHDCVKVEKHHVGGSPPWIEWWKPGLFIVKWIDWWVPAAAPVEWELVSIE